MAATASTESLRIGIGLLDREHGALLEVLNALQDEIEGLQRHPTIESILNQLARGTEEHFRSEEAMMRTSKYPGFLLHALKHEHLIEQLNALRTRYYRDRSIMGQHTLSFLYDWFATHIHTDDTNFALWQNENR